MNRNAPWKYLLLVLIAALGITYAMPNLFGEDLGVQVIGLRNHEVTTQTVDQVNRALDQQGISAQAVVLENGLLKARFADAKSQLTAQNAIKNALGGDYGVALSLLPSTPSWLSSLGANPMNLGLDLRGGVHFLMQVDMEAAQRRAEDNG